MASEQPWWGRAKLLAGLLGLWYGLTHIPEIVEGIPFVQVMPAMMLGGIAVLAVDLLRVAVAPKKDDRTFLRAGAAILTAIILIWIHQLFYRLGLVEADAEEHYDRLSEDVRNG